MLLLPNLAQNNLFLMNFDEFTANIDIFLTKRLGEKKSHFKMIPKERRNFSNEQTINSNPKLAGVLALFFPDKNHNTHFLLTQRATYKGKHSGQISFPGGKQEINDLNIEQTALRETKEEVGVDQKNIKIIRKLTQIYIPPSNFMVTPFLSYTSVTPIFKPNYEVAKIITISLNDLLNDTNISTETQSTSYMGNIKVPCFKLNNYIVWGATAMILSEIKDLIK